MADVIEIEDRLDERCVRHVHLMSNERISEAALIPYGIPSATATVERGETAGSHYLIASGPCRLVWNINAACKEGKLRRLVAWSLEGCDSVRGAIRGATHDFKHIFKFAPKYVFMKKLPKGAENCVDVEGMILLEAEWMLERAVAVGGRR